LLLSRDYPFMEGDELRKKLDESEELLEEAEQRQEEVEAQIDEAHQHEPDEEEEN
jgi:hypothetical protein